MTALTADYELMSVEDYLAAEILSEAKHEYLGGAVYAMAGASEAHNIIASNLARELGVQLRGKPCRPFGSDMQVRLLPIDKPYIYYPDAMVACDPSDSGHGWRERPSVLFEIISEQTRRIDEREKRLAYLQLSSLEAYVRIEQTAPRIVMDRHTPDGWKTESAEGLDSLIQIPSIGVKISLSDLFEGVQF